MDASNWILAIADDLTGALETGTKFADQGIAARVTTDRNLTARPDAPILVVDTETRHLQGDESFEVVRTLSLAARGLNPWMIYKKTDSTLRGNIRAEFSALLEVFPERELVYMPAYPRMGRTVRDGILSVDGVPVHRTAFAHDPLGPVRGSDIRAMLAGLPVTVLDGESDADVSKAAKAIVASGRPALAAGPAAFAGAIAEQLRAGEKPSMPTIRRCLVVNGSLHPVSLAQFAAGRESGGGEWRYFDPPLAGRGMERAMLMGEAVRGELQAFEAGALIVFGGDTAFGIHRALGAHAFESYGEILDGVPLSRSGGFFWITKAGGFGASDLLCDIRERLK